MTPQVAELLVGELEHELRREAVDVSFHCSSQRLGFHAVEGGQISVEYHFVPTDEQDGLLDLLERYERGLTGLGPNDLLGDGASGGLSTSRCCL